MEVGTAVRKAFYTAISGLVYNGMPVNVFDEYDMKDYPSPYVQLSTQTEQQMPTDDAFFWDCTILVKVVAYGVDVSGKKAAEDLGALIQTAVLSLRGELINTVAGFDITGIQLSNTNTLPQDTGERVYITKLYRYSMQVQQF